MFTMYIRQVHKYKQSCICYSWVFAPIPLDHIDKKIYAFGHLRLYRSEMAVNSAIQNIVKNKIKKPVMTMVIMSRCMVRVHPDLHK